MNESILFCGTVLFAFLFRLVGKKLNGKILKFKKYELDWGDLFFKALSVGLFMIFMPYLFLRESIAYQYGLTQLTAAEKVDLDFTSSDIFHYMPYSPAGTVFLVLLKWMTLMTFAVAIVLPFFNK